MATERTSARMRIVLAAFELIQLRGVKALTLDGVAGHAKLSKGGVLYHFSGKDDLVSALLQQAISTCRKTPAPESWLTLVQALLAAYLLSPRALEENFFLFEQLLVSFSEMKSDGDDFTSAPHPIAAIGFAFVSELRHRCAVNV